jgi:Methyltransferase domain
MKAARGSAQPSGQPPVWADMPSGTDATAVTTRTRMRLLQRLAAAAAALVLADPERRVASCDPVVQPNRERYLDLLRAPDRTRLTLLAVDGAEAAADGVVEGAVDLLFIDSSHTREATLQEWHAWRPRLAPGALVVFDDHGHPDFPGVAQAVAELGLSGRCEAGMFVWQGPERRRAAP